MAWGAPGGLPAGCRQAAERAGAGGGPLAFGRGAQWKIYTKTLKALIIHTPRYTAVHTCALDLALILKSRAEGFRGLGPNPRNPESPPPTLHTRAGPGPHPPRALPLARLHAWRAHEDVPIHRAAVLVRPGLQGFCSAAAGPGFGVFPAAAVVPPLALRSPISARDVPGAGSLKRSQRAVRRVRAGVAPCWPRACPAKASRPKQPHDHDPNQPRFACLATGRERPRARPPSRAHARQAQPALGVRGP